MKGKRLGTGVFVAVAAAALLATTAGFSQMHRHQMRHHPGEGFGPGFLMGRMVERLELTEAQQEQIHNAMQAHHETMEPLMRQLHEAKQEVARRIHAPELDEIAIRDAAAAVAPLEAEIAVEKGRVLQSLRAELTPEQQAELDVMLADMHERRAAGGDGFGPRPGRSRAPGAKPGR